MSKKRVVSFEDESNKRIKAICIFHEFLSSIYTNDEFITKNEFEKNIEQRLRQFILKDKKREEKNKQIESEIKEKKKTKKNYSQKSKTIRDREKMIKYFNEQKIIARVKNVDRAAWHYALIKLKTTKKYKQMRKIEREKAKTNIKKDLKAKRFRDEMFDKLFFHDFSSRINEAWLAIWFEQ